MPAMIEYLPYPPRHARHADPGELPPVMRALADKIVVIPSKDESSE